MTGQEALAEVRRRLHQIADWSDEACADALTLHYDMRGWAEAGLNALDEINVPLTADEAEKVREAIDGKYRGEPVGFRQVALALLSEEPS